jgi:hypothetical protein
MRRKTAAVLAAEVIILMIGCGGPYNPEGEEQAEEGIRLVSELFEEMGTTEAGETVTRFYTNDREFWTQQGFTAWTVWGDEGPEDYSSRKVKVSKSHGSASAGYGLVLCQGTREVDGREIPTMLTVMINNEGKYAVGEVIGGRYESLVWWTATTRLQQGVGAPNVLEVRAGESGIELIINGEEETEIVDDTEPKHRGGKNGYIVVIAPMDTFPADSVDVQFTEER